MSHTQVTLGMKRISWLTVLLLTLVVIVTFGGALVAPPAGNPCNTSNFELAWGLLGSGLGQFNAPMGVAADSSYNVYVPIGTR